MKNLLLTVTILAASSAFAQNSNAQAAFAKQQAYAEMQRVSGQIDVLENNVESLQGRVSRLERSAGDQNLRDEINALKTSVSSLRNEMKSMRDDIVRDLSERIVKIQKNSTPPPPPKPAYKTVNIGPHLEHTVRSGDTLSLIAEAFGTTVPKIKEMNPDIKPNNLRVGQKINVPAK